MAKRRQNKKKEETKKRKKETKKETKRRQERDKKGKKEIKEDKNISFSIVSFKRREVSLLKLSPFKFFLISF